MTMEETINKFVDASFAWLRRHDLMRLPSNNMPAEMRGDNIITQGDWIGWKPIQSTATDSDLNEFERVIQLRYPPTYRYLLKTFHFYELHELGVRFHRHPVDRWKKVLKEMYCGYSPERILGRGLIPFGSECFMDAGFVCFDTNRRFADGDCPIVYWDHEWVGSKKEVGQMFSSSIHMFQSLTFASNADTNFVYHDTEDKVVMLVRKKQLLKEFLAIDPDGAGGIARSYWTGWGVNPDAAP